MEEKQKRTPFSHWEQLDEAKKEQFLALMEKGAELERSLTEEQTMARNLLDLMSGERMTIEGFLETVQPYTTWSEETREEVGRVGLYVKQADERRATSNGFRWSRVLPGRCNCGIVHLPLPWGQHHVLWACVVSPG